MMAEASIRFPMNPARSRRPARPAEGSQPTRLVLCGLAQNLPWARMLVGVLVLATSGTIAWGAAAEPQSPAGIVDAASAMSPLVRAVVYGVALLGLCALSFKFPDAPALVWACSIPMAEFVGLRVALMFLQCLILCYRTGTVRHLVPSRPFSIFLVWILASMSWAFNLTESMFAEGVGITALLSHLPTVMAVRGLLSARLTTARRLLGALTLGCLPGCGLIAYNALAGLTWHEGSKAYYMGFIQPDIFSPMLVMSGVFLLFCVTSRTVQARVRIFAASLLPAICVALLLTGIRSGWTAFLTSAAMVVVLTRSRAGLAVLGGVGAAFAVLWFVAAPALGLVEQLSTRFSDQSLETGQLRVEFWQVAAQGFWSNPVLGIGWGSFPSFLGDSTGSVYLTHNIFVRIACELGVVGLALFFTWAIMNVWRARHSPDRRLVATLTFGVLVQGLFLDHFTASYFWLFLGVCDGVCWHKGHPDFKPAKRSFPLPGSARQPVLT